MQGSFISALSGSRLVPTLAAHDPNGEQANSGRARAVPPLRGTAAGPRSGEGRHHHAARRRHPARVRARFRRVAPAAIRRTGGGTADALRFIQSEYANKPDGIGLDMLFGGGQEPYYLLADKKLTSAYRPRPDIFDGLPRTLGGMELHDANFHWFGAAISSFGILQNTFVQRTVGLPTVTRWSELADPRIRGWVGAGDPRNSSTMYVMYESFLQAYGWEKGWATLTQIGGNARNFDRQSSSTAKDVTLGETAYAFAIDFYGASQIGVAGPSNMVFTLPADFTAINADGICILKG